MRFSFLFVLSFFFAMVGSNSVYSAEASSIDSLSSYRDLILTMQKSDSDSMRKVANDEFIKRLEAELKDPSSFQDNFDSLSNLSHQKAADESFKIYTWVLASPDLQHYRYYGYLQIKLKNGKFSIIQLRDSTSEIKKPETEKLKPERWLGAVYYSIVPIKKSGKTYYTLLGWKGKNRNETQKLIDILYIENGKARFGFPLIKTDDVFRNRMIFTYTSQASMVLRYEEKKKMIVFDHISGIKDGDREILSGEASGPDGSYDGLKNKRGRWVFQKDVDVRSDWKPAKSLPKSPVQQ